MSDLSWTAALVNHLWQSTAVVVIAWLLAAALKKNHARVRYWVWFAASAKFLVPFAALIALGGYTSWRNVEIVPYREGPVLIERRAVHERADGGRDRARTLPSSSLRQSRRALPSRRPARWLSGCWQNDSS